MRQGELSCPECFERPAGGSTCHRCDVPLRDEHGNEPAPARMEVALVGIGVQEGLQGADYSGSADLEHDVFAYLHARTFGALAREIAELRRRRRFRRAADAIELSARIADASAPQARVRGTVRVIEPVVEEGTGRRCAAFVLRQRHDLKSGAFQIATHRGFGRFRVVDDSGVATVDDDFVVLLDRDGRTPPATGNGSTVVADGDLVEVAGPAARDRASSADGARLGAYRAAPTVLRFDGRSDAPLVIRLV